MQTRTDIFCPECGKKNEGNALFCENCGARLEEMTPSPAARSVNMPSNAVKPSAIDMIGTTLQAVRRIPPKTIRLLASVASLMVVAVIFYMIGAAITNPDGIVKGYFKALSEGEYEKVYAYLSLDETDFINAESFTKYMSSQGGVISDLINFSVSEDKPLNTAGSQTELSNNSDDFVKTYTVKFASRGMSSQGRYIVTLVKSMKKKLLFFDDYIVSIDNLLLSDHAISVPKGSIVSVDGVVLSDPNVGNSADSALLGQDTSVSDEYILPKIFPGEHELSVQNEFCEDYFETIYLSEDRNSSSTTVSKLIMKESIRNMLAKKTEEDYSKIFQGAIEGKDFAALGLECTKESEAEAIRDTYADFFYRIHVDENGEGYVGVTFKSFADGDYQRELRFAETSAGSSPVSPVYICELDVLYDYSVIEDTSWFGVTLEEREYTDKSQNILFTYIYENDIWVLQTIDTLGYSY
jgi:hypothetical protein